MRTPEQIADQCMANRGHAADSYGYSMAYTMRPVTARRIAVEAAEEAQKPLAAVREYAQKIYDDCEMPTTDSRESAMFYFAKSFIELLDGEGK